MRKQSFLRLTLVALGSAALVGANSAAHTVSSARHTAPVATVARADDASASAPSGERLRLTVNGEDRPYDVFAVFVLPGETVRFGLDGDQANGPAPTLEAAQGAVAESGPNMWTWTAPSGTGLVHLSLADGSAEPAVRVNAFVMEPVSRVVNGRLNGYPIGTYPAASGRRGDAYVPPRGFIEVTAETRTAQVSPHFQLGQFVCKEDASYPKYLVLNTRLVDKLELILAEVNRRGFDIPTFHVMSGYRTPAYNHGLGNVKLSRHQFGDAADIFVDANNDDVMDDLNRDGKHDMGDSRYLYDIIEEMSAQPVLQAYTGGMGYYHSTSSHGPFVHVDARGFRARWVG